MCPNPYHEAHCAIVHMVVWVRTQGDSHPHKDTPPWPQHQSYIPWQSFETPLHSIWPHLGMIWVSWRSMWPPHTWGSHAYALAHVHDLKTNHIYLGNHLEHQYMTCKLVLAWFWCQTHSIWLCGPYNQAWFAGCIGFGSGTNDTAAVTPYQGLATNHIHIGKHLEHYSSPFDAAFISNLYITCPNPYQKGYGAMVHIFVH